MAWKTAPRGYRQIPGPTALWLTFLMAPLAGLQAEESSPGSEPSQAGGSSSGGFLNSLFPSADTKTEVTSGRGGPDINQARQAAYDGPRARIAVARFTDKTGRGWYSGSIGDGMADQLTTALFNTNRFIVLERQTLSDVLQEQDLGASGRVKRQTAAPIGNIEGAELLVTGAVTEFEGKASGGGGNVGGGLFGQAGRIIGSLASAHSSAHMAIDIRVVDTASSRIVAATSVQGTATDVNMGAALLGATGGGALGGSLSGWQNTPIEKALRECIQAAVQFIASKTPRQYYRRGQTTMARAAVPAPASAAPASTERSVPDYQPGMVARVSSSTLNVRGGPGGGHGVKFTVEQGNPLLVLGRNGDWIQIKDQQQRTGWTAAWLTFPDATVSPEIFEVSAAVAQPAAATPAAASASAAPAQQVGPDTPRARLKRIETLREQNIITDDEYQELRTKILSEL